ncbi:hypothetical protein LWI28_026238 [Acer negundo]|uniref:Uncharacterized protein n=1 Tax=Acer negundo TaxID=4023 RepID=A0AAD5J6S6_ACENE|nr:hypothetical protein LWI28_026238 [Acer negundo]
MHVYGWPILSKIAEFDWSYRFKVREVTQKNRYSLGIPLNKVYKDGFGPSYADVVKASRNGFGSTDSVGVQRMMQVPCNDSGPTDSQGMQRMEEMSWDIHANDLSWLELSVVGVLKSFLDVSCVLKGIFMRLGWAVGEPLLIEDDTFNMSNLGGGVESTKAIVTATRKAVTFQNSSRGLTVDRVVESPKVTRIEEGIIDAGGKDGGLGFSSDTALNNQCNPLILKIGIQKEDHKMAFLDNSSKTVVEEENLSCSGNSFSHESETRVEVSNWECDSTTGNKVVGKKRRSKNNGLMASARKSHSMMLHKDRFVDSSVAGGDSNLGRSRT